MSNTLIENCIFVLSVKESENEDTNVVVTETLNALLQEKLTDVDIDQSHWTGKLKKGKQLRLIIIKFARYSTEYSKPRKSLKTSVLGIDESLTQK